MMKRVHANVDGRVQGVGFRFHTQFLASEKNVTGWVRNKLDGTVEIEAQGDSNNIESFLSSVEQARFPAKVTSLKSKEIELNDKEVKFSIR
ncbi:acylphosphatase [Salipaludibacillus sp. HK11]|uniref:acylphosphatase n=1 Tax=Salipaludibacillus sp. HK11 TaxID=3394320 RepID=UPI0039FC123F